MKITKRLACALLATLAAAGCVQNVALTTPFEPARHGYALGYGSATISGQAFLRRNDGIVVYAAGSPVLLLPATGYTNELMQKYFSGTGLAVVNIQNADTRLGRYVKETQANGEGRFAFTGVPDGPYYIVTEVAWMAGNYRQGGMLTRKVEIFRGQSIDLVITR